MEIKKKRMKSARDDLVINTKLDFMADNLPPLNRPPLKKRFTVEGAMPSGEKAIYTYEESVTTPGISVPEKEEEETSSRTLDNSGSSDEHWKKIMSEPSGEHWKKIEPSIDADDSILHDSEPGEIPEYQHREIMKSPSSEDLEFFRLKSKSKKLVKYKSKTTKMKSESTIRIFSMNTEQVQELSKVLSTQQYQTLRVFQRQSEELKGLRKDLEENKKYIAEKEYTLSILEESILSTQKELSILSEISNLISE
jgi:hypothetical protein